MVVQKSDAKAIGYFITLTSIVYIWSATWFMYLTPGPDLTIRLIIVISGFVLMYLFAGIFHRNPFKARYSSPYLDGLIHVLALMAFGNILVVIVWFILFGFNLDMNAIYLQAKPAFVSSWNVYLPIFALIFWGINGLVVAFFYHSVTYELFEKRGRLVGMGSATALFILNYNAPLLSNYWNIGDIVFFGFIFAYSYSVKRNPLALLSAYLLFEVPLWWCILAPFGERVFEVYFILRIVISLVALIVIVYRSVKRIMCGDRL